MELECGKIVKALNCHMKKEACNLMYINKNRNSRIARKLQNQKCYGLWIIIRIRLHENWPQAV